jgi:hypothetical protein
MYNGQLYFEKPKDEGEWGYRWDRLKRGFLQIFTNQYDLSQSLPALNRVLSAASILPPREDPSFSSYLSDVRSLYNALQETHRPGGSEAASVSVPAGFPEVLVRQDAPQAAEKAEKPAQAVQTPATETREAPEPQTRKTLEDRFWKTVYHQRAESCSCLKKQIMELFREHDQNHGISQVDQEIFPPFDGSPIRRLIESASTLSTDCCSPRCQDFDSRIATLSTEYQKQMELFGQWKRRLGLWTQFDALMKHTDELKQKLDASSPISLKLQRCLDLASQGRKTAKQDIPPWKVQQLEEHLAELNHLICRYELDIDREQHPPQIAPQPPLPPAEIPAEVPAQPVRQPQTPEPPKGQPTVRISPPKGFAERFRRAPAPVPVEESVADLQARESREFQALSGQLQELTLKSTENEKRRKCWVEHINWPGMTDRLQLLGTLDLELQVRSAEASALANKATIKSRIPELRKKAEELAKLLDKIEQQYVVYAQYAVDKYEALRVLGERSPEQLIAGHEGEAQQVQTLITKVQQGKRLSEQELVDLFRLHRAIDQCSEELEKTYETYDLASQPAYTYLTQIQSIQEANLVLLEYFPSYQEDQKGRIDQLKDVYAKAKEELMQQIRENKTTQFDIMAEKYRKANDTIVEDFLSEERWSKWHADLNVPLTKTRDEFLQLNAQERRAYLQQTLNTRFSLLRKLRS